METVWKIAAYNRLATEPDGSTHTVQYIFEPPLELPQSKYPDTDSVAEYLKTQGIPRSVRAQSMSVQKTPFVLAEDMPAEDADSE